MQFEKIEKEGSIEVGILRELVGKKVLMGIETIQRHRNALEFDRKSILSFSSRRDPFRHQHRGSAGKDSFWEFLAGISIPSLFILYRKVCTGTFNARAALD